MTKFVILYFLSAIAFYVFAMWSIVVFCLYLFKDRPFDIWLLWALIISFVCYIGSFLLVLSGRD